MKKIALLLAGLLLAPGLWAQDFDKEAQEIERKRKALQQVEEVSEQAQRRLEAGPEVTFQDILKDPDNVALNYRFARSQVAKGQLKGASATLERILMVRPDLPKVRLLYAVVFFRLGALDDAEREFKTLQAQPLSDEVRAELEKYTKEIRKKRRRTHWGLSLAAGFDFDENRNSAPNTGKRLVVDVETILDEASTRRNDTTRTMSGGVSVSHDMGYQAGHFLFASGNYYRSEAVHLRTLNLQSYSGSLGIGFKTPFLDITPAYEFSHVLLAEATYIRSHGGKLNLSRKLSDRVNIHGTAGITRQDYNRTEIVPTGNDRSGDKFEGGIGFDAIVSRDARVGLSYSHGEQGAEAKFNSYSREEVTFSYTRMLPKGRFLLAGVTANFDDYKAPDPTVSAMERDDHTWRPNLTFGTPLGLGLTLTLSYEYFHSDSNLLNNSYTNNKLSSLVSYRWGN